MPGSRRWTTAPSDRKSSLPSRGIFRPSFIRRSWSRLDVTRTRSLRRHGLLGFVNDLPADVFASSPDRLTFFRNCVPDGLALVRRCLADRLALIDDRAADRLALIHRRFADFLALLGDSLGLTHHRVLKMA